MRLPAALQRRSRSRSACLGAGALGLLFAAACSPERAWFQDEAGQRGVDFSYESGPTGHYYLSEIMGGGVGVLDYDNDGDLDLYFTNGGLNSPSEQPDGRTHDRLYRQEADGQFSDVSTEAGIAAESDYGMGVATGDVNNDGWVDLFVTNYGHDRLLVNQAGTFVDMSERAGIDDAGWSASAAFCDYDRDGYLDLYVTKYVKFNPFQVCRDYASRLDYCGPQEFAPLPDRLWHNNGNDTFSDTSDTALVGRTPSPGLGVVCDDLNQDGWVDFYVANDGAANQLWINQRDGRFVDQAVLQGVAFGPLGSPEGSMGTLAADLDLDGLLDLFVTNLPVQGNRHYHALGSGSGFSARTDDGELSRASHKTTGFGTAAVDVELDGDLDIAVVNGRVRHRLKNEATLPLPPPLDELAEHNQLYLNDGGLKFHEAGEALCGFCQTGEVSRGLATGDLDNDGDVDLVVNSLQSPAGVYYNQAPRAGHWLEVRAIDPRLRRDAIGAQLTLRSGDRRWRRTIATGYSYLAANDPRAHFGVGEVEHLDGLDIRWPDGLVESVPVDCLDCAIEVRRGEGSAQP